ncbi:MarR family transcriptional regulator [Staphylococcus massiliensis]|uniref:transcriptional regulator, SarA/Rot family n=1 Tax=Staphylococcus massiliensis TaxID=555791 RepID=UPI001EDF4FF9|nr:MarR family transcriptional regulator [Staphylococcus massiliensis]MCG3400804.1 MarR family transcriptional regulator [Staphylococcus massiliensis]
MASTPKYNVSDVVLLDELQKDIDTIFESVEKEYKLTKDEFLILITLWHKGSMTLKEMDKYVKVKSYKRTRTFNDLVEKKWIYKERPENDERTVIIHFNEDFKDKKDALVTYTCEEIKSQEDALVNNLKAIIDTCKI